MTILALPVRLRPAVIVPSMIPTINSTRLGSITIEGEKYKNDVLIRLGDEVVKCKKKLSKAIYGTSHVISLDEAKYIFEEKAERLIIGIGQTGMVKLSDKAADYFRKNKCQMQMLIDRLSGNTSFESREVILKPIIIVRESTSNIT